MYNPAEIESKWQSVWEAEKTFAADRDQNLPKYYVLDMFPYPSGIGLHVGHLKGYVASDVVSRYMRMKGYDVLHPMGWDSFGLPTERQADREGITPQEVTTRNVALFRKQLKSVGLSYDWDREFATSSPEYYKWTQWIWMKLYEKGLAYLEDVPVNWCPALNTVLANEEVVDGKYVETGDPVERRMLKQWMLRITQYADELLEGLDGLDWPEAIKSMQRNWIGRSEGAYLHFSLKADEESIETFTTRPDTIFGVTYIVLSPEHELVPKVTTADTQQQVEAYCQQAKQSSERERMAATDKTGVFTGGYAVHPLTGDDVPIWVADYVIAGYGTGAVMGVPAHDTRDEEFATKFALPIIPVIAEVDGQEQAINSECESLSINGLSPEDAKQRVTQWLADQGIGGKRVQYKLRDWLFSRQRYWGEPFPVAYAPNGQLKLIPESDLPVVLPGELNKEQELDDASTPSPPLAFAPADWRTVEVDGEPCRRETNTMPQWAGSCWYYLRFIDPHNEGAFCDADKEKRWMPVDLYVGGAEHATLHLLYARFWHRFLYDLGVVSTQEPFARLFNQGMIHARSYKNSLGRYHYDADVKEVDGKFVAIDTGEQLESQIEKMSKSKCNGLAPEDVIADVGADALRLYEMFMGPVEDGGLWDPQGVRGTKRFLDRLWRLREERWQPDAKFSDALYRSMHQCIGKVTTAVEALQLNIAISQLMTLLNSAYEEESIPTEFFRVMAKLLQPFAPHFAEELWSQLGAEGRVAIAAWPELDAAACVTDVVTIPVQINGKLCVTMEVDRELSQEDVVDQAKAERSVAAKLKDKTIRKTIFVPQKILNFVVS